MVIDDNIFPVSETFVSIQGEGPYAGMNSFFIRFQFCNLKCKWCDTKYTWSTNKNDYELYTFDKIKNLINNVEQENIILTGGEPLMYRIDKLIDEKHKFHVETSGNILPNESFQFEINKSLLIKRDKLHNKSIENFTWIVSPKLSHAGFNYDFSKLKFWSNLSNVFFKFIIEDKKDFEIIDDIRILYNIAKSKIYIGIEGITLESQLRPEIVDEIVKRGYNYSPRLHIILWGSKRGK